MAYVTLVDAKKHLNIETEYIGDDAYITSVISVVEEAISKYCDGGLTDLDPVPVAVKHAALLLVAHLYVNRTMVSFAQGFEIPYSFKFLLNPYKAY